MLLALALLAAALPEPVAFWPSRLATPEDPSPPADAAAALRAYSLRAPMFYETELRAFGVLADHDGTAQVAGGAGVGVAVIRVVTPPATAMASSWTALRAGTAARLAVSSGPPRLRLEVPFLFGAERAIGGISARANWRGYVLGAAAAPQVILGWEEPASPATGGGQRPHTIALHAAWVRAEMHLDRVALEGPKEPQLRVSLALQAPVGYPETLVALGVGIAWY
jgi:hypothetical protein